MSLEPIVVDDRELYGRVRPSSGLRLIYFAPSMKFPKMKHGAPMKSGMIEQRLDLKTAELELSC